MAYADKAPATDAMPLAGVEAPASAPEGEHAAKLDAADSAIAAAEAGDREGFVAAMSDFVRICMKKYS